MLQTLLNVWTGACRTCHRPYEPLQDQPLQLLGVT